MHADRQNMTATPPFSGDEITVGQLADRLGVEDHEAFALCVASRIPVRDTLSLLSPADVARVDDVLAGRVALKAPRKAPKVPFSPVKALIVALVLLVLTAGVVGVVQLRNRTVSLEVQPGDCFDAPDFLDAELKPFPCDREHDFEAFATVDLITVFSEFPGEDEMQGYAMDKCRDLAQRTDHQTYAAFWPKTALSWRSLESRHLVCATPTDTFSGVLPFSP